MMDRRAFLRMVVGGAAAASLQAVGRAAEVGERLLAPGGAAARTRPNIILILADDMGFSDIGCYGGDIATPNIDRLAAGGMRFTHFYNNARCCPTRAGILTGLYPHQAGVGDMIKDLGTPAYQGYLNDRCVTLGEALGQAGYRTLMSGKWHVGENRPHWPTDRGFERYFGLISGACNYYQLDKGRQIALQDTPYTPGEGFYMTDAITEHAVGYLDEVAGGEAPFFLYTAYTAPHWPLHALPEDIAKYRGRFMDGWDAFRERHHRRLIDMGIVDGKWPLTPRDSRVPAWTDVPDKEAWDLRMAVYAAQVDRMDQGIGRILGKLRETGQAENTLVLFLSDNGGCAEVVDRGTPGVPPGPKESFMSYGIPWANASNTPFRLYKTKVHEGGISTPLVAYWPGVIQPNSLTHQVGHVMDLMPTFLDAAGAAYPTTYRGREITPVAGKSLLPVLQGKQREGHDIICWEHEGNTAIRQGKWKLVSSAPDGWELYDMEADRTEMHNLAGRYPDTVRDLLARYTAWAAHTGAKVRPALAPAQG